MDRNPALQPWSREHFTALALGRDVEKAVDGADALALDAAVAALRQAMHGEVAEHFASEEQWLAAHVHGPLREHLDADHAALRELTQRLDEPGVKPEVALALARRLRDHVRWEERVLYPHLAAIGRALADPGEKTQR
jgi:hypothetical protein